MIFFLMPMQLVQSIYGYNFFLLLLFFFFYFYQEKVFSFFVLGFLSFFFLSFTFLRKSFFCRFRVFFLSFFEKKFSSFSFSDLYFFSPTTPPPENKQKNCYRLLSLRNELPNFLLNSFQILIPFLVYWTPHFFLF